MKMAFLEFYTDHKLHPKETWPRPWFYGTLWLDRIFFKACLILTVLASRLSRKEEKDHGKTQT